MPSYVKDWPKTTLTSAIYITLLLMVFVMKQDFPLFLLWLHTPVYFLHQFEEYVLPGGFLGVFNRVLGSKDPTLPLDATRAFWINVPVIFVAYPLSALLATEFGLAWGIWVAYFSVANALSHVVMAFKLGYNPGLVVSVLLNIPVGLFTIWYFSVHHLISVPAQFLGLLIGLGVQVAVMIYGFAILRPSIPISFRVGGR